ncbi:MAG TPA: cobalamin-dependent protein [Spirochaetia bacterium]|nr:cobalamin-dependent protein [Spirochaetia bacterium]
MADFATRLRDLRKRRGLRQMDLAQSFGVAQTTIANYEKKLRFPDERMLGRFADFFDVSMDFLLGRSDSMRGPDDDVAEVRKEPAAQAAGLAVEYLDTLRHTGFEAAMQLIDTAFRNGMPYRRICQEIFEPALKEVGRLWELGQLSVGAEHAISEATVRVMAKLFPAPDAEARQDGRPRCVCLSVSREQHVLGAAMVTDFLRLEGWSVVFPGANLSTGHLLELLKAERPDLCAISVTLPANVSEAREMIAAIRETEPLRSLPVMVGGQAFQNRMDLWQEIGADGTAVNAEAAVATAARLVNRPA